MRVWLTISRGILGLSGALAALLSITTMSSGSPAEPIHPIGLALGLVLIGTAAWTTAPGAGRAIVVWVGVIAVGIAAGVVWSSSSGMRMRDQLVYIGLPLLVVVLAALTVARERVRAGAVGAYRSTPPAAR
jgi:hypothetical protein